ncbi:MAG: choice-of-anchor J domain-containing protein, partial [Bacteroidales bacterium]|nr:choice-of-anchor J domain-containing protein [Bacteroidales bacterium]
MKSKLLFIFCAGVFLRSVTLLSQTYFFEGFENRIYPPDNTTLPQGWTQSYVSGNNNWEFQNGGHTKYPQYPYTRKPYPAKSGSYNALFQKETFSRPATRLITPPINVSHSSKPMLIFWHAQASRYFFNNWTNDELRVFYRTSTTAPWTLLAEYTNPSDSWTERNILLPPAAKSNTLYIAFEGRSMPGWGTCIDDISIIETDTIPKTVNSISATSPFNTNIGRGIDNALIMRLDIAVKGNLGTLTFDSLYIDYTG